MPKLLLTIILITAFTGFACAFATANGDNQKSTKLVFNAIEVVAAPPDWLIVPDPFTYSEGNMMHTKNFWSYHELSEATIGDDTITGYTFSIFHLKINIVTGNWVLNGQTWVYFTWGDLSGYFTGPANGKVVNAVVSGKFTLQGFEDFEGMKLFGIFENENLFLYPYNELSGIVLIPN